MSSKDVKIKFCGIKRFEDILYVNILNPDYIGFVFANSKRQITFNHAKALKINLNPSITPVGVFVDEKIDNILYLVKSKTISMIQLHGNEDQQYINTLKELCDVPIIKAIKIIDKESIKEINKYKVDYFLFDSKRAGSGQSFDWSLLKDIQTPYFLAGGLNYDNILEALKILNPFAVDISSGIETNNFKDFYLMDKFIYKLKESN